MNRRHLLKLGALAAVAPKAMAAPVSAPVSVNMFDLLKAQIDRAMEKHRRHLDALWFDYHGEDGCT